MLEKPFKRMRDKNGKCVRDQYGRYKYALSFRVGGRGTRRINRRDYFKDDLEAAAAVARLRGMVSVVSEKFTWEEGYKIFSAQKKHLTEQYRKEMKFAVDYVRKECAPTIEGTTLAAYTEAMRKKAAETSARRANNIRIQTLSVARFCEAEGLIGRVPFDKAPARPEERAGRSPFPLDQFADYYKALDEYGRPLLLALAASGDRVTAVCRINVLDVNLPKGYVAVTKKGGKERKIPLSAPLLTAIRMASALEPTQGRRNDLPTHDIGALFVDPNGKRWNRWSFRKYAHRAWREAGLKEQVIHSLRNMIASELADTDANRYTISASLGHDHTATADIYVKARDQLRSARLGLSGWGETLMKAIPDAPWCTDGARNEKRAP